MTESVRPKSSARRQAALAEPGKEKSSDKKADVRIFDDLDLAAYVEELLTVKVDELGTALERIIGDNLLDLVESNKKLLDRLSTLETAMRQAPSPAVAEAARDSVPAESALTDELKVQVSALQRQAASLEDNARGQQDEIYRLRDERSQLLADRATLQRQDELSREREQGLKESLEKARDELARLRSEGEHAVRKLDETSARESSVREETTRLRDELVGLRAEVSALKKEEEVLRAHETSLQDDLRKLQRENKRLIAEERTLRGNLEARGDRERELNEEILRLQESITAVKSESAALVEGRAGRADFEELQRLKLENQKLVLAQQGLQSRLDKGQQQRLEITRAQDEASQEADRLQKLVRRNEETITRLEAQAAELHGDRDRAQEESKRLQGVARDAEGRSQDLQSRVDTLGAERDRLADQVHTLNDPEKFTNLKLKELHQQIVQLEATMREKDRLLGEAGKDQLLLGQELEKERKEKYENQVAYERKLKETQTSLARETREKDKERQERQLLEEQLAKYAKKKWPLW